MLDASIAIQFFDGTQTRMQTKTDVNYIDNFAILNGTIYD